MQHKTFRTAALFFFSGLLPALLTAQQPTISNLRAYDKSGINIFEDPKDSTAVFNGIKVKFGAGFTQQFQNIKQQNPDALNNHVGSFANGVSVPGNQLKVATAGFQTAQANLYMDVQLADGIRLNITSYLSTKHHNETWVKAVSYTHLTMIPSVAFSNNEIRCS